MTKKVFDVIKYVKRCVEINDIKSMIEAIEYGWPQKLQGLTVEECLEMNYSCSESWTIEVEV